MPEGYLRCLWSFGYSATPAASWLRSVKRITLYGGLTFNPDAASRLRDDYLWREPDLLCTFARSGFVDVALLLTPDVRLL